MLSDLFTRLFRDNTDAQDEDSEDPGFTTFMETLHARRSAQAWYAPGPEGDLYRQQCRDEEMMRLESRNYGFMVKTNTASTTSSKESESSIGSSLKRGDKSSFVSGSSSSRQQKRWKPSKLLRKYSSSSDRPKRVSSIGS